MTQPDVTVIVPVFNVESYLSRCIESLLAQAAVSLEIILVDDGSTDRSGMLCDQYASKNTAEKHIVTIHQKNRGLSAARNTGIDWMFRHNRKGWVTFVDSDDWLHPEALNLMIAAGEESGCDIVICDHQKVSNENQIRYPEQDGSFLIMLPEDYWTSNRTNATTAWGKLYRSDVFQQIRYPEGKYHEDEYVTYKLLFSREKLAILQLPLYYYFQNPCGISSMDYLKRFPDIQEAFQNQLVFFHENHFEKAYQSAVEKYAEALSNMLWASHRSKLKKGTKQIRAELRKFLQDNKEKMSVSQYKEIYIAAYPTQQFWIRLFGFLTHLR